MIGLPQFVAETVLDRFSMETTDRQRFLAMQQLPDLPQALLDDPNRLIDGENPALVVAIAEGDGKQVRELLKHPGIDVNKPGNWERTPVWTAVNQGQAEILKLLLARPGIDVNKKDTYNLETPLEHAHNYGFSEIAELLRRENLDGDGAVRGFLDRFRPRFGGRMHGMRGRHPELRVAAVPARDRLVVAAAQPVLVSHRR